MRIAAAIVAVVLLTLGVFAPVRDFEFVSYDDPAFVSEHPIVLKGLAASAVGWLINPVNGYSTAGGPVTFLSHMLDVELFGMRPGPQHLVNLGLHTLNAVLLLLVLWRMTGAFGRSTVVAALFAVHPLHVESVAWITERKDVLSGLFWMLTMHAYVSYARKPGVARYSAVFALLTLGLLSKATLVTLPIVLLLLDAWPLRSASFTVSDLPRWRWLVVEKLPLLVPVVATIYFILSAQTAIGAVSAADAISWTLRLQSIVVSYATYLFKTIWPAGLAVFYPFPHMVPAWKLAASGGALFGLSFIAWRFARTRPFVTIGWLWFLVTLTPMIGIVQVGSHSMADRFTYVPLIGVFIATVWGLAEVAVVKRRLEPLVAASLWAVVVVLGAPARAQVEVWRNSETLWSHALGVTPDNFRAYAGLAEVVAARGDTARAIGYYKEAVRLAPDAADYHVNLGLLQSQGGQQADAIASFRHALAVRPDDAETENNLGATLALVGQSGEAVSHYLRALELRPAYALARRNLGLAYANAGNLEGGARELLDALKLSPDEGQWHYEAAVVLLRLNRVPEGVAHLRDAVRLAPNHQAARDLLAQVK
ncbi:MAG TPA: tetratricopeptide repeat protein [Vicinamibacterales bacterium]|nr:tetratricopeptide repeat protein [Vicinamibacterales bacterium]